MPSRLIRATKVLPETMQIKIPYEFSRQVDEELASGLEVLEAQLMAAHERESDLRRKLDEAKLKGDDLRLRHTQELETARADAVAPVKESVRRFSSMIDDFLAQREELLRSSEEVILKLAVAIARRIIGDAVEVNREIVLTTVRQALMHVMEKETVVVRVHPDDLKVVREHRSEWLSILEGTRSLEIVEDERISIGGCLVETEAGNVEAQIDRQLKVLKRSLIETI